MQLHGAAFLHSANRVVCRAGPRDAGGRCSGPATCRVGAGLSTVYPSWSIQSTSKPPDKAQCRWPAVKVTVCVRSAYSASPVVVSWFVLPLASTLRSHSTGSPISGPRRRLRSAMPRTNFGYSGLHVGVSAVWANRGAAAPECPWGGCPAHMAKPRAAGTSARPVKSRYVDSVTQRAQPSPAASTSRMPTSSGRCRAVR